VPGLHAGGDDEAVVLDLLLACHLQGAPARVQLHDVRAATPRRVQRHVAAQGQVLGSQFAGEHLLGQRGPVVGAAALGTDDRQLTLEAQLTQPLGGAQPREATADDDDAFLLGRPAAEVQLVLVHRTRLSTMMACMGQ
jgi:hypothetical protein